MSAVTEPLADAVTIDPARLAQGYELLREQAVGTSVASPWVWGRLVLVRQGMVAWLHLYAQELQALDHRLARQCVQRDRLPPAPLRSALAAVLTDLVLGANDKAGG